MKEAHETETSLVLVHVIASTDKSQTHISVYRYLCTYIYIYYYLDILRIYVYMHLCKCIHMHVYMYVRTYRHACMHAGRQVGRQAARLSLFMSAHVLKLLGGNPLHWTSQRVPRGKSTEHKNLFGPLILGEGIVDQHVGFPTNDSHSERAKRGAELPGAEILKYRCNSSTETCHVHICDKWIQ